MFNHNKLQWELGKLHVKGKWQHIYQKMKQQWKKEEGKKMHVPLWEHFLSVFTLYVTGSSNIYIFTWIDLSVKPLISHVQHIYKLMRIGKVMGK